MYNHETINTPIVLMNSPIEFIVIGPKQGKDVILIKSQNAGLDLAGLMNYQFTKIEDIISNSRLITLSFASSRQLNFVESLREFDIDPSIDRRRSVYRFAWVGFASRRDKLHLQIVFNELISNINYMIKDGDLAEIEMLMGTLILETSIVNQKRLSTKKTTQMILVIYSLIFILIAIVFIIKYSGYTA